MRNEKQVEFYQPVKRYVNAIERHLYLPWKVRARVMSDVSTTMRARHEAGESYEEIMADMGTPKQVAEELNEQMSEFVYRKSPWRFLFLALALCTVLYLCGFGVLHLIHLSNAASLGVIGGADGPTEIFVTTREVSAWTRFVGGVGVILVGLAGYWKLRRCKQKK